MVTNMGLMARKPFLLNAHASLHPGSLICVFYLLSGKYKKLKLASHEYSS